VQLAVIHFHCRKYKVW